MLESDGQCWSRMVNVGVGWSMFETDGQSLRWMVNVQVRWSMLESDGQCRSRMVNVRDGWSMFKSDGQCTRWMVSVQVETRWMNHGALMPLECVFQRRRKSPFWPGDLGEDQGMLGAALAQTGRATTMALYQKRQAGSLRQDDFHHQDHYLTTGETIKLTTRNQANHRKTH